MRITLVKYYGDWLIDLTKKERDCLMEIGGRENSEFPIRLVDLADTLSIKSPTALNLVKRLEIKGIVHHEKGMITLSTRGIHVFHEIEENHRVLETLMVNSGMDLDKACILSEAIDFQIDHSSVDKIFIKLGKPGKCPHGRVINQFHDN